MPGKTLVWTGIHLPEGKVVYLQLSLMDMQYSITT